MSNTYLELKFLCERWVNTKNQTNIFLRGEKVFILKQETTKYDTQDWYPPSGHRYVFLRILTVFIPLAFFLTFGVASSVKSFPIPAVMMFNLELPTWSDVFQDT